MARIEVPAELQRKIEEWGTVDVVVGITGAAALDDLRAKASCLREIAERIVVAYAGVEDGEPADSLTETDGVHFATFPMSAQANSLAFWLDVANAQRGILAMAAAMGARACLVSHSDLAALAAKPARLLLEPVLEGKSDLMMPVYPDGKYDRLINKGLLAPLSRALFGRRVWSPLAYDFSVGKNVLEKLAHDAPVRDQNEPHLLWPANIVAMNGGQVGEAVVRVQHATQADDLDLSAVLAELAGSLFQEAEACAAYWQRIRGSQAVPRSGNPIVVKDDPEPVDPRPMVESFVLGSRNLEEVWRLVLPPATMLELKRLTRLDAEQFRMPDALWARIVYDFALAHRLRRVSRTHVLGALTPLYLGWVASYTQEVGGATAQEAEHRIEQLARAYEEQKPYFVSRWRWPERLS